MTKDRLLEFAKKELEFGGALVVSAIDHFKQLGKKKLTSSEKKFLEHHESVNPETCNHNDYEEKKFFFEDGTAGITFLCYNCGYKFTGGVILLEGDEWETGTFVSGSFKENK